MKVVFFTIICFIVVLGVSAENLIKQQQLVDLQRRARILGGLEVIPNSLPYQALLYITTSSATFIAGGSLISANYVLSAASMLFKANTVEIYLGKHNKSVVEVHELKLTSTNIIIHDKWNQDNLNNDIALVMLPEAIKFTPQIAPIALPRFSDIGRDYLNESARISGWGSESSGENLLSEVLIQGNVSITENLDCQLVFPGLVHHSLCSKGDELIANGISVGDSGGPLVLDGVQIGIASFAHWDAEGFPTVYTRIWSYLIWIADNADVIIIP